MEAVQQAKSVRILILILGSLIAFGPLSIDMYLSSLPDIAKDLDVPLANVQFSLTAFFIGLAIGQVFYGPLSDRLGRKIPIYIGLAIYTLASFACAISFRIESLIAARFLQALGSCAGMVASRAVVRDLFEERQAARVFSMLMLVMGLAPILAPLVGAYLAAAFGWRSIFYLLAVLSIACFTAINVFLPETHGSNPSVKLTRAVSVYRDIMKDSQFVGFALAGGIAQAGMFAYITGSPYVFIDLFQLSPEHYAWLFGANALALIAASQLNVRLLQVYSLEQILKTAFVILATAGIGLAAASLFDLGFWPVVGTLFIYIGILGLTLPNTTAAALAKEGERAGSASAMLGTIQFIMAALSSSAVSALQGESSFGMAIVIACCGIFGLLAAQLTLRSQAQAS